MRILLLKPNSNIPIAILPLGLMYLSSYLKKKDNSYDIKLIDGGVEDIRNEKKYVKILSDYHPDIVGISALNCHSGKSKQLATLTKKMNKNTVIVLGGPYPSSDYQTCLSHADIDYAVVGEGEETFFELVKAVKVKQGFENIKGLAYKKNGTAVFNGIRETIKNLDTLPFPDYSLININSYFFGSGNQVPWKKRTAIITTSRGCPFRCGYCHNIFGESVQFRSIANVIGEISFLKKQYNIEEIGFADDCFNADKNRAKSLLKELIKSNMGIKLSFPNGLRIDKIDEEFITLLKKAQVYNVAFGLETATKRNQVLIKKNLDLERARHIIAAVAKQGIIAHGFFMLGFPEETEEEMLATIKYAVSLALHTASFNIVTPFPGTELWQRSQKTKKIIDADSTYKDSNKISINLSNVNDERLYQLKMIAYRKFYFDIRRIFIILRANYNKHYVFRSGMRLLLLSLDLQKNKTKFTNHDK